MKSDTSKHKFKSVFSRRQKGSLYIIGVIKVFINMTYLSHNARLVELFILLLRLHTFMHISMLSCLQS